MNNIARLGSSDNGDECAFATLRFLIRHNGIQLTIRERRLVDAEIGSEILRKKYPRVRMILLIPLAIPTQMIFILLLKFFGREVLRRGDRS